MIFLICSLVFKITKDFPGGLVVKSSPPNVGSLGSIPSLGAKIPLKKLA